MLDGPRVAVRTLQSPALLLPEEPRPALGATWTRTSPTASPAGTLTCTIAVSHERLADGVVVLRGEGDFRCTAPLPEAPLVFRSGTFSAEARFDAVRGVFLSYDERSEMVFEKVDGGEETRASWHRVLTLQE